MSSTGEYMQELLERYHRDGYVILPEKIPEEIIDRINQTFRDAPQYREKILLRKGGEYSHPGPLGIVGRRRRVIDFYVPCHAALEAVLAQPITDFLSAVYGESPLAFQALLFQYGSQQSMHQDPAYVVTDNPDAITASWIALEDIQPGSGELVYYVGSHRGIDVRFAGGKKVWVRHVDDKSDNISYSQELAQACEAAGLRREVFRPQKGEILIWHAGLVHGGSDITEKKLTRKSLVTHYCPASGKPNYFNIQSRQAFKQPFAGGYYSSRHYDVRPESNNPYPVFTGGKNIAESQGLQYGED